MTELEAIAYQEAGHTVVSMKLGYECASVSIVPDEKGNPGRAHCEDPRNGNHERGAEHYAIIALAGPAAQRKFDPELR